MRGRSSRASSIEGRRRHDHAGGAEAALEGLRVEKGLLHGMQLAVLGQALDGGDLAPGGAEGRDEAAMEGHAVEPDRAGAAIALVAALLDAEPAVLAQEGAQALAGRGLGRKLLAVDREVHGAELRADLLGVVIGEVTLVGRRAVHVVEPVLLADMGVDRLAAAWPRSERDRT